MHDIRRIRENPAAFDAMLVRRGLSGLSKQILGLDQNWRDATTQAETIQADLNATAKAVGAAMKAGKIAEAEKFKAAVAGNKVALASAKELIGSYEAELKKLMRAIPNAPLDDVPDGDTEAYNRELRRWGAPRNFAFAPKEHFELGEAMGLMDFETAAKLSGSRFTILKGQLARLERVLGQFMLDVQTLENGYTEVNPPLLVRDEVMYGTGQLPKFGAELFFGASFKSRSEIANEILNKFQNDDHITAISTKAKTIAEVVAEIFEEAPTHEDYWLIPTAEVPLTNLVREDIVDQDILPLRFTALTPCFRSEAGSAGKDTRGMLRQHQFEKVEMVSLTKPEDSEAEHERMTRCAEDILERLGLPYRTVVLCTGDLGFAARRTHDIEVWLPGQDTYREISSCSVCGDFQARRMNARFRREGAKRPEFLHTLNGSGLAVGRTLIAVMENYQEPDGAIAIPAALRPYMRGAERINADGSLG